MKGFNLRVKEFREAIAKDINEAGLPICITSMVISEVLQSLKAAEYNAIDHEQKIYEKELAEKEQEEKGSGEDGKQIPGNK
jgi:hypothetical protein